MTKCRTWANPKKGMVNMEYKRYLARIPKTYAKHSTMS
jgi:hypothetical protein